MRLLFKPPCRGRILASICARALRGLCFWLSILWCACSGARQVAPQENLLASQQVKKWLQEALTAVVGVSAVYNYQLTSFRHQFAHGKLQPDASSPTGFRLLPPPQGAIAERELDIQRVNGGGLIIYRDLQYAVILTSAHVFNKPDTIYHYDRADTSVSRRLLLGRAVQKSRNFYVINQSNQYLIAEVLHQDQRTDLALLQVPVSAALGTNFPFGLAAPEEIEWGDFVYVIGYPREVKQLSTGVVSRVPFPGAFILDTVARFGFSGGPVFIVRPESGLELAGVVRGVPANKLRYVAPPKDLPAAQVLNDQDLKGLASQEIDLIDYGTTYAVGTDFIKKFLHEADEVLKRRGIELDERYVKD
ncbi:MAG: S1 family peptidase [bacterium]